MEDNGLVTAIENVIWSVLANANVCMPGKVESYSFSDQKANIQPLIKRKYKDGSVDSYPVLTNVPVVWLRTARSGFVFPLKKGDGVLIVFIQRSTERWRSSTGEEVEPADSRKFDLSDAVAIPGLYSLKQENIAENNDDLLIKHEGTKVRIKKNGQVEIQSGATGLTVLDGVVTGKCLCAFTGAFHPDKSAKVKASK